ncbi:hypothetical protein EPA93_15670 [Ktedonosporobacter rubrisoli]|uniref:Transposase IS110-like N-terminal domain-containing protein n=1 Tax=Ktedonosporobacter rubrisoli TaxID=2509675 RepID=A0A4P6JQ33_KTERU|nr:transposase [Ktedonosporobacter rubrisoli]QBD77353.1 hypothetical protein EPA93_15670 [Ktedonosporobacter rubrisoli]
MTIDAHSPNDELFNYLVAQPVGLYDWLKGLGVTNVAMESTGSFWNPIFNMLEGHLEVMVVNAQHLKAVPGRKTDLKDANGSPTCSNTD